MEYYKAMETYESRLDLARCMNSKVLMLMENIKSPKQYNSILIKDKTKERAV